MGDSGQTVEQRLAAARERYIASLHQRHDHLQDLLRDLGRDPDARDHLQVLAHRLAGSAGMHDLAPLSEAARSLDQACIEGVPIARLRPLGIALEEALADAAGVRRRS